MKLLVNFGFFHKGLLERATGDQLCRGDVFQLIAVVSANYHDLAWSQNEIATAWPKTRNIKNEDFCVKARERGNAKLKEGKWLHALSYYNESIVWAPSESQHLTLAIANRAFIWIKLEEYQKAETDLEWLLSINKYPQDTQHKIYQRLGIVKFKLRKAIESIEAFRKSYELLKFSNLSKEQKRSTIEELNSYI